MNLEEKNLNPTWRSWNEVFRKERENQILQLASKKIIADEECIALPQIAYAWR